MAPLTLRTSQKRPIQGRALRPFKDRAATTKSREARCPIPTGARLVKARGSGGPRSVAPSAECTKVTPRTLKKGAMRPCDDAIARRLVTQDPASRRPNRKIWATGCWYQRTSPSACDTSAPAGGCAATHPSPIPRPDPQPVFSRLTTQKPMGADASFSPYPV